MLVTDHRTAMYSNRRSDLVLLPHLTRLHETYRVGEGDPSKMTTIPSQHRVTIQILKHWYPFQDLKLTFAVGVQIPLLVEIPLSVCGCKKFQIDTHGDHLCNCTTHSGVKNWQEGSRLGG